MALPQGGVPERPKGTGCKPVGSAYGGSNPPAPTRCAGSCSSRSSSSPSAAEAGGHASVETRTVAPGGFALEDHWTMGDARAALDDGRWDVVVLQQGPSSL